MGTEISRNWDDSYSFYVGPNGATSAVARAAITTLFRIVQGRSDFVIIDAISDIGLGAPGGVMPALIRAASEYEVVDEEHPVQLRLQLRDQPHTADLVAAALPWTISGEVFADDIAEPTLSVFDTGNSYSVTLSDAELLAFEDWCYGVPASLSSCLKKWEPSQRLLARAWRRFGSGHETV